MSTYPIENEHPYDVAVSDVEEEIGVSEKDFNEIQDTISNANKPSKAVAKAFSDALNSYPSTNPTVLWNAVVRVAYVKCKNDRTLQSWRSASGEGFEIFVANRFTKLLENTGITINHHTKSEKLAAVETVGLDGKIGDAKVDLTIQLEQNGSRYLIGFAHLKTSLRERLSEDADASKEFMRSDLLSVAITLDAQYELGSSDSSVENRSLIEERESFTDLYSLNSATEGSKDGVKCTIQQTTPNSKLNPLCDDLREYVRTTSDEKLHRFEIEDGEL